MVAVSHTVDIISINTGEILYRACQTPRCGKQPKATVVQIDALTEGIHSLTLRVKVLSRSAVRKWNKFGSQGQFTEAIIADRSAEIRIVAFNAISDKYYPIFEVGTVIDMSFFKCEKLQPEKNPCNSQYGLILLKSTVVDKNHQTTIQLPMIEYPMLFAVVAVEANKWIDLCDILCHVGDVQSIRSCDIGATLRKQEDCAEGKRCAWESIACVHLTHRAGQGAQRTG